MADEMDKNHDATPFKLMEARRKGQVAKSNELPAFFGLSAMMICIIAILGGFSVKLAFNTANWLGNSHLIAKDFFYFGSNLIGYSKHLIASLLTIILAGLITTIVATIIHVGPVFSTFAIKPDFNKINPASGLKKIFSMRALVDLGRLGIKVAAFSFAAYIVINSKAAGLLNPNQSSIAYVIQNWIDIFLALTYAFLGLFFVFAIFDLWYSKRLFAKQMRMSSRDVKDESKNREGDPMIKAKRKRALIELLQKSSSIKNVKDSDVVIVNPTHVAIALKYRVNSMAAPTLVAKGQGVIAAAIKREAIKYNIPIVRKPLLARALLKKVRISQQIPEELKLDIAGVYKWVIAIPNNKVFSG